jgi:hypothetical protein
LFSKRRPVPALNTIPPNAHRAGSVP